MSNHKIVHETILRDVMDLATGIKDSDEIQAAKNMSNGTSFKSITSKSEALTLVFPVIASKNMSYDAAAIVSKAIERKAVTMLHMLFAASNITDAKDGIDYLSRFHTNLRTSGAVTVDDFVDTMDRLIDECGLLSEASYEQIEEYERIKKDLKNMNFYLEESILDDPLDGYRVVQTESGPIYVNEKSHYNGNRPPVGSYLYTQKHMDDNYYAGVDAGRKQKIDPILSGIRREEDRLYQQQVAAQKAGDYAHQKAGEMKTAQKDLDYKNIDNIRTRDDIKNQRAMLKYDEKNQALQWDKINSDIAKADSDMKAAASNMTKNRIDSEKNRLMDYDVKKANELIPSMMYVNFVSVSGNSKYPIESVMVIGVKAKLYAIDADDIMNRVKIKNSDRNLTLNLVKVSTREISFFKDFMFAIDRAKIDALSQSRRGSSNKIWKVLERRALKSKMRRSFFMSNDATAITTLVVSQEDVEYLKKTEYINLEDPRVVRPILDAYNLMGFVIVDESLEIAKFIFDTGDDMYEVLTFDNLEREQKDNSKKIINLMSKINR